MRRLASISAGLSIFICFFFASSASTSPALSQVKNVRFSSTRSSTRIVLDLSQATPHKVNLTRDKKTLIIELDHCRNSSPYKTISPPRALAKNIHLRQGQNSNLSVHIVLEDVPVHHKVFSLRPYAGKPHRLVIDLLSSNSREKNSSPDGDSKTTMKIVVIDPGHGGEDPGAIGCGGLKEKDIVLQIARELKRLIPQAIPDTRVYLTRDGDYYLPLHERVKIAHQHKADLFISLHINASRKKYIEGTSVYFLSQSGASDKAAELLAARENASDLMAGVTLSDDKLLNSILIDLVQTFTINESVRACKSFLNGLVPIGFYNEGIKCANFAVLRSPSIPSVLLEIGYITNAKDIKKIRYRRQQTAIARQLVTALKSYFDGGAMEHVILQSKVGEGKQSAANARF